MARRQKTAGVGEGLLDGFFEAVVSGLKNAAHAAAENMVPRCVDCGDLALPVRCLSCGKYACPEHAFVNRNLQILCSTCASECMKHTRGNYKHRPHFDPRVRHADFWESAEFPFSGFPRAQASPTCWQILGVAPGASDAAIKKAFRMQAKACHPDMAAQVPLSQRAKLEERFIALSKALEEALAATKNRR